MHHPALLLILLLLLLLWAPLIGQGIDNLGMMVGPMILAAPGGAILAKLTAPMAFGLIVLLGVSVVGLLKLVVGL